MPSPLFKVSWFGGENDRVGIDPNEDFDSSTDNYVSLQNKPKLLQFGIIVKKISQEITQRERNKYKKGNFGGWHFMIGGDDAEATSERLIHRNGLIGREYVYGKAISFENYTRGRIFYFNNRLYFIIFLAPSAEDLMSPDADRFLNSFHIVKRRAILKRKVD